VRVHLLAQSGHVPSQPDLAQVDVLVIVAVSGPWRLLCGVLLSMLLLLCCHNISLGVTLSHSLMSYLWDQTSKEAATFPAPTLSSGVKGSLVNQVVVVSCTGRISKGGVRTSTAVWCRPGFCLLYTLVSYPARGIWFIRLSWFVFACPMPYAIRRSPDHNRLTFQQ
jgi:hypothetical protein